jgi:phage shock protein PspC (stress-responsive transcriptional regulator)
MKKLIKSEDKIIDGICGGISNYINIDVTIIRLFFVCCIFIPYIPIIILYIVLMCIMPNNNE